jgi:hypothetical protein
VYQIKVVDLNEICIPLHHHHHLHGLGSFTAFSGSKYRIVSYLNITVVYYFKVLIKLKIDFPFLLWSSWITFTCLIRFEMLGFAEFSILLVRFNNLIPVVTSVRAIISLQLHCFSYQVGALLPPP